MTDEEERELIKDARIIAIVGLSPHESRASNVVARYLQGKGYRIIPVNPGQEEILGEKSYKALTDIPQDVDIVDIFMRAEKVVPIVEEAVRLGPKAIWLQLGIVNHEARQVAEKAGIPFVQDLCLKQEHARLLST